MTDYFVPGIIAFGFFAICVPLIVRLPLKTPEIARVFYLALIVEAGLISFGLTQLDIFYPWHATAAYGLFFMLSWFSYGAVAKSISLVVAVKLAHQDAQKMSQDEAASIAHNEFDTRIDLLCDMGHVQYGPDQHYEITSTGKGFAGKIRKVRSVLNIHVNGLYS